MVGTYFPGGACGTALAIGSLGVAGKMGMGVLAVGLAAVVGSTAAAGAATVTVLNPNFAQSHVAVNHYDSSRVVSPGRDTVIPGWGIGSTGGYASAGIHNNGGTPVQYTAYVDFRTTVIYQDVAPLAAHTRYTLSVLVRENTAGYGVGSTGRIALVNTPTDSDRSTQTWKGKTLSHATVVVSSPGVVLTTSFTTGKTVAGDLTIELSLAKPGTSAKTGTEAQFTNIKLTGKPMAGLAATTESSYLNGTGPVKVKADAPSVRAAPTRSIRIAPSVWKIQPTSGPEQRPVAGGWGKPSKKNPNCRWYQTSFQMPKSWATGRVLADFRRIEGDAIVFLNGHRVHELLRPGGYVDLSKDARPGLNSLLVYVTRSYVGISRGFKQDVLRYEARYVHNKFPMSAWNFGVTGPVVLYHWPRLVAVSHVLVQTNWDPKTLKLHVWLNAVKALPAGTLELRAEVLDEKGNSVLRLGKKIGSLSPGDNVITLTRPWADPVPWRLDASYLYALHMSLYCNKRVVQRPAVIHFGFRSIGKDGRNIDIDGVRSPWRLNANIAGLSVGMLGLYKLAGYDVIEIQPNPSLWWTEWNETPLYSRKLLDEADKLGMGILMPVPAVDNLRQSLLKNAAVAKAYKRALWMFMRKYWNHPCILAWSVGMNTMNTQDAILSQTLGQRTHYWLPQAKVLRRAFAMVRQIDPTRLVYSHADGNIGDIATSNLYLDFTPLQEREDWLETWSKKGTMPFAAIEFGNTFLANYDKRGQILFTEYFARWLGPTAYYEEPAGMLAECSTLCPSMWGNVNYLDLSDPSYWKVQKMLVWGVDKAWRASGESAGHMPWDFDVGLGNPPGWNPRQLPYSRYSNLDKPITKVPAWVNENFWVHRKTMRPLLAYIAGWPEFTDKTHSFESGQPVKKQIALVWDGPGERALSLNWSVSPLKGPHEAVAEGHVSVTLKPGATRFEPIQFAAPHVRRRTSFVIRLVARQAGRAVRHDRFPFAVFPGARVRGHKGKILLWDPAHKSPWVRQLVPTAINWKPGRPLKGAKLLIIGRKALTGRHGLPFTRKEVARGMDVLCLEQMPRVWDEFGLKADETYTRRVFAVNPQGRLMKGLKPDDLLNWTGSSRLLPSDRQYCLHNVLHYPRVDNLGIVSPVVLQIPERVGFTPVLVSGFDLNYASVLAWNYGRGRVIFSTLALGDRLNGSGSHAPAVRRLANNLIDYASARASPTYRTQFLGDASRAAQLGVSRVAAAKDLTTNHPESRLWIVGPKASLPQRMAAEFLSKGGHIAYLRASVGELKSYGLDGAPQSLRRAIIGKAAHWPASLPPNLGRWRGLLHVESISATSRDEGAALYAKGLAAVQRRTGGEVSFLQATPASLLDGHRSEAFQKATQLSVQRLRQLDADWLTLRHATCSSAVARRLTTLAKGPVFRWLKFWQVLGPIPDAVSKGTAASDTEALAVYGQSFPGRRQAIAGQLNPNVGYTQRNGVALHFQKAAMNDRSGRVNLLRVLHKGDGYFAMAATTLDEKSTRYAVLRLGVDYWCRVYVNGQLSYQGSGGPGRPQANRHAVRIKLKKGRNIIAVQVVPGSGGFGFWANLSQPQANGQSREVNADEPITFYTPLPYPFDPYEYIFW